MIKIYTLEQLFIGYNDGKKEARHRSDFEEYYFDYNGNYEKILQHDKYLLLGRKGTGKSLLGEYIKKKSQYDSNWFCKISSYKQFKFHELNNLKTRDPKPNEYFAIWEWIVLLEIAYECIKDEKIKDEYRSKLKEFLTSNFMGLDLDMNKVIEITKTKKINGKISIKNACIGADSSEDYKLEEGSYLDYIQALKNTLINALKTSESKYTIIFDELDDRFKNEDLYKSNIISLIKAVNQLNELFIEKELNCKVIVLLRSDIFYILNDPDLNKIEVDGSVKIDWSNKLEFNSPMIHMILIKIKQSLMVMNQANIDKNTTFDKLYKKIFPQGIRINKGMISAAKYVLSRTYLRPRDVVTYLNMVIKLYPNNNFFQLKVLGKPKKNIRNIY